MSVTRIKNNQITDSSVTGSKLVEKTITAGLLADNITYPSNLTISGNLTVSGTTTTVDTTNILVSDPLIVLNRGETGVSSFDSGIVIERGTSTNVAFIWDESADVFALVNTNEDGSTVGDITISSYASAKVNDIEATTASLGNIGFSNNNIVSENVDGNISLIPNGNGNIVLSADTVVVGDSNINTTITTNGTGDLLLNTDSGTNSGSITIFAGVDGDISILPNGTGNVNVKNLVSSNLTDNRVLVAGTGGAIEDSANLTFDGTTFSVVGNVTVGNISINSDTISSVHNVITIDPSTAGAGGTVIIEGNLQVTGNTTTVESTVVSIADPVFQLGSSTADDNLDRGIKALYNDGVDSKIAFFGFDDSTSEFVFIADATDTSSVFSGSFGSAAFGSLRVTDLTDNRVLVAGANGEIEGSANLTYDGTDLSTNSLIVSDLTSGRVLVAGSGGSVEDSSNLTFNSNSLNVVGNVVVDNITIDGNSISSSDALTIDAAVQSVVINEAGGDIDFRIETSGQANAFFIEGSTGNIGLRTATPTSGAVLTMNSTDSFVVPVGTTAQRPLTPVTGMTRYNTTLAQLEFYDGFEWNAAGSSFTIIAVDSFVGDGSTIAFSLSEDATSAGVLVAVNGFLQDPGVAYNVSGSVLTFTTPPALNDNIDVRIITTTVEVVSITDLNTSFVVNDSAETATTTINGNVVMTVTNAAVVPGANLTYDLGSSSLQWNTIYGRATGNTSYTASSLAPSSPNAGDEWWDTDDGNFYKYIDDGTTSQWVEWGPNNSLNGNELITGNLIPDVDATYNIGSPTATLLNIYATASSAKYADLAENYLADTNYPIGTVLMLGGEAEVTIAVAESTAIVGTVSQSPAYLMNSGLIGDYVVPVSYIGRVPCRVVGTVNPGDHLIVSSIPGVAKSSDKYLPGQLIGKAIGSHNSDAEGTIEILVGRL